MSGICGIWQLDGRPVERVLLAKLSATMAHRGPHGEGFWVEGSVGMAFQHLQVTPESLGQPQPLVDAAGPVLVFDGRLDNRDELLQDSLVSQTVTAKSPDTEFVMAAYRRWGPGFPEHLNGDFALALFDPKLQQLFLVRDAIGIRPLYYCRLGELLLFATDIKALLAHPRVVRRPNERALAEYLIGPRPMSDFSGTTLFEGVSSVPPGHVVVQSRANFVLQRYWDFDPEHRVRFKSPGDYAAAFRHHFEQAVRRRLRSTAPVAVSVSGGLDSSSIFCMGQTLKRQHPDLFPVCHGISHISSDGGAADERRYLDDIDQQYGCVIDRVPLVATGFADGARSSAFYSEDPIADANATFGQLFLRRTRLSGSRVLLTGHWGDQMLGGTDQLMDLFHQLAWGKLWVHLNELPRWQTDVSSSFGRSFLRRLARYHVPVAWVPALKAIRSAVGQAPRNSTGSLFTDRFRLLAQRHSSAGPAARHRFATRYAAGLYEEVRKPYNVQCMEWNNKMAAMHGMEMAFPFLDRDLISYLLAIPGDVAQHGGVARWILREGMTDVLPPSIKSRRWKADFTLVGNQGASLDFSRLFDELAAGCRPIADGYIDEAVMKQEIKRLMAADWHQSHAFSRSLGTLYGLELWLRTFF